MNNLNTTDYLFLRFRSTLIKLDDVSKEYYPHLCKQKVLEKARLQKFPFACIRIDDSQKGPFFVDIHELARVLDDIYKKGYQAFHGSTQKSLKSTI